MLLQLHRLQRADKQVRAANEGLRAAIGQLNLSLNKAKRVKDEYISYYLSTHSQYLDKLEALKHSLQRFWPISSTRAAKAARWGQPQAGAQRAIQGLRPGISKAASPLHRRVQHPVSGRRPPAPDRRPTAHAQAAHLRACTARHRRQQAHQPHFEVLYQHYLHLQNAGEKPVYLPQRGV
jgi:hypothetical protein